MGSQFRCGVRQAGRGALAVLLLSVCSPADRALSSFAEEWASVLCEGRNECGCASDDCQRVEASRFLDLWGRGAEIVPNHACWDSRISELESLTCDEVEVWPFDWETRACPLRTNFAGIGETCLLLGTSGDVRWATCENGLVCESRSNRCVLPDPGPAENEPCYFSSATEAPADGHCSRGLRCSESEICGPGDSPAVDATIVCTSVVLNL